MQPTNTFAKLFSSVSTLAVVAGAMAFNGVAWGQVTVLAWGAGTTNQTNGGSNWIEFGQCIIPASANSGVSAIAGGWGHTIALKDGAVLAWGFNGFGQCTIPDSAKSGVSAIECGEQHTIALKGGTVLAWGVNDWGQCLGTDFNGNPITSTPIGEPVKLMGQVLTAVTAIAGGELHTIALKGGAVLAWGSNYWGQCLGTDSSGTPITSYNADGNIPVKVNGVTLIGVTAIADGWYHTIALKDGAVMAWGDNSSGQCTIPASASSGVSAIAGSQYHTVALKDGAVLAWGQNNYGECNIPASASSGVSAIAAGTFHTIALKDGAVLAWGADLHGDCTIPDSANSGVSAIASGYHHTIALKGDPNDTDCDGIPNATDNCPSVSNPTQADCDGNGIGDACELDCNQNGLADVCEILSGAVTDQNLNGIPDTCEVSSVSRVLPISGPSTGGTAVRIIGTNFFSALPVSVFFNGAPATDVVVVSLTEITAVTPSGGPGGAYVDVNGVGTEAFYYRPSCDGDLDNNGTIDSSDLGLMLVNYGNCYESAADAPQEPMIFPIEAVKPIAVKK